MLIHVKNLSVDAGMVIGTYNSDDDTFATFERPAVALHFLKSVLSDLIQPRSGHSCGPACHETSTLILGSPFHENVSAVAPRYVLIRLR